MENLLSDLISDETYEILQTRGMLSEKTIRDHRIRIKFKALRAKKIGAGDAIDTLLVDYPYLQFDTIRKIVYEIECKKVVSSPQKNFSKHHTKAINL